MSDALSPLLRSTRLLDFLHPSIETIVAGRRWRELPLHDCIGAAYDFVRNDIAFGYHEGDELPASRVLAEGIGQCNTKSTLLMALLRASGVPCRLHGFTIDKAIQKGAITGPAYLLAPSRIMHSWVEVRAEGRWVALEGCILDARCLAGLQRRFPRAKRFCGLGVAAPDLSAPAVEWRGADTFIQKEAVVDDFGVFDDPDAFHARHGSNLSGPKRWLFERVVRHRMNANVRRVRDGRW